MPSISPDPTALALRYALDGDTCLYRDVHGRRVVADFEGACEYRIGSRKSMASEIDTVVDGLVASSLEGNCRENLVVVASQGPIEVEIARGSLPTANRTTSQGRVVGVGFVLAASAPVRVDGRPEFAPSPSSTLPIPFFRSAESNEPIETATFEGWTSSVVDAFGIEQLASLKERGWAAQNISRVETLSSRFADGSDHEAAVASHLNAASWNCAVPDRCGGLVITKTYDRFHGRQRARVLVDGQHAGWWYEPVEDRERRWGEARFGIPAALLGGKSSVRIAIDPVAGSPLWSVSRIEVIALWSASA